MSVQHRPLKLDKIFYQNTINKDSSKELHNSVETYAEIDHRVAPRTCIGLLTKGENKWEDPYKRKKWPDWATH